MSNFRTIDRETGFFLPPSVDEWLPERHLARFVVEVIDGLDLSAMVQSYRGSGSASYHPALFRHSSIRDRSLCAGIGSRVTDRAVLEHPLP
jgi:transposase